MIEESWILYMGTFPPRECGIATFTKDLTSAIDKKLPFNFKTKILALNKNSTNIYNYPDNVIFQLDDVNIEEYMETAKRINQNPQIKLVNIQHEFGIFGGIYGNYLIPFLELLQKPVAITFHSVLPEPDDTLKQVVQSIAKKVSCIIVMTPKAVEILQNDYGLKTKIKVIPHGIPTVPFSSKKEIFQDKFLLTSFGLISSSKGYEYVIDSLPEVVKKFPNLLYLILGETHPVVRRNEGEKYRNFLESKVKELGLQNHVKFYNKYLTIEEIIKYLRNSDIYISPSLEPRQITSGTLSYALGCGVPAISTPFLHAKDIINHERGLLTKFRDPSSFTEAIIKIFSNPGMQVQMKKNAYAYTRNMTWPNVALSYLDQFKIYMDNKFDENLPEIKLNHLTTLTDDFGIIQFANHDAPDINSGYTLDDNARAMIVAAKHYKVYKDEHSLKLINTYLDSLSHVQQPGGKLLNLVNYQKKVSEFSDDAHGRGLWALGYLMSIPEIAPILKERAQHIFNKAINATDKITSPRAVAFIILGLYFYQQVNPSSENKDKISTFANHLISLYRDNVSSEWQWFEGSLSYSNSKLPEALLYAYLATGEKEYLQVAKTTLDFLCEVTFENNFFIPVGQNGWYVKKGQKAYFDQQPVDTASMVQTLTLAYEISKKEEYKEKAITAFHWFLGNNSLRQMIYNEDTGGCHDGLGEFSINLNQGAESTISYLMARLTLENKAIDLINLPPNLLVPLTEAFNSKKNILDTDDRNISRL
jgi:glycosyltransferase involved in cell wall biosynthesis